jgi:hypothetical protein
MAHLCIVCIEPGSFKDAGCLLDNPKAPLWFSAGTKRMNVMAAATAAAVLRLRRDLVRNVIRGLVRFRV